MAVPSQNTKGNGRKISSLPEKKTKRSTVFSETNKLILACGLTVKIVTALMPLNTNKPTLHQAA